MVGRGWSVVKWPRTTSRGMACRVEIAAPGSGGGWGDRAMKGPTADFALEFIETGKGLQGPLQGPTPQSHAITPEEAPKNAGRSARTRRLKVKVDR
jgi:hypothetical protein